MVGTSLALAELSQAVADRPAMAAAVAAEDLSAPIRVLLRRSGVLDAATAQVSCESAFVLRDSAEARVVEAHAGDVITVGRDGDELWVATGEGKRRGTVAGAVRVAGIEPRARVLHVPSGEAGTAYRGDLEIRPSRDGRVAVLNVLQVEKYLAGVIPRELPASFGIEPARAQAIAARGYAVSRKLISTHPLYGADVCDAIDCQAYGGAAAEHPLHDSALASTRGLVLWRDGKLFEPLYSSTCGGHTDAVADGALPNGVDLRSDVGAAVFFKGRWDSNCAPAPRYRWSAEWDRRSLEETLNVGLRQLADSSAVTPAFPPGGAVGRLTGLTAAERSVGGRVLALRIDGTNGSWTVRRDWTIRSLLRISSSQGLSSTAFALELVQDGEGSLAGVVAVGGGWGHGVGMCQWGTRALAGNGLSGEAIVAQYYPGTELAPLTR